MTKAITRKSESEPTPRQFAKLPREQKPTATLITLMKHERPAQSVEDTDDASLYLAYREQGDMKAFEMLFRRHRDGLMAYLWLVSGSQPIADDISQYCWLKLIENGSGNYQPREGASLLSFLRTVGRNRYIDEYQRKHAETRTDSIEREDTLPDNHQSDAMEDAATQEQRDAMQTAIGELPVKQRDVVAMWLAGFSIAEMTKTTGAPRDTVLSRKKYGLRKIKERLRKAGWRASHGQ